MVYTVHLNLHKSVGEDFELKTGSGSGKVDVLLNKQETGVRWSSVGKPLERNGEHVSSKDREVRVDFIVYFIYEVLLLLHILFI